MDILELNFSGTDFIQRVVIIKKLESLEKGSVVTKVKTFLILNF